MVSPYLSTPVASPCSAVCHCTGRNSTLLMTRSSWAFLKWLCRSFSDTLRKSSTVSTGGGTETEQNHFGLHTFAQPSNSIWMTSSSKLWIMLQKGCSKCIHVFLTDLIGHKDLLIILWQVFVTEQESLDDYVKWFADTCSIDKEIPCIPSTLTTLHHAPEPQVTHRANPVHHKHQMVHLRHLSWGRKGSNSHEVALPKKNTVTRVEINQRTLVLTIRDFIMIIIYAPLDHSGPRLAILCGAPLIWHSRRLELHDHLEKMAKHNA